MDDKSELRVPYAMSVHGEDEINACVEVLRTSTQMGPCVGKFEKKISLAVLIKAMESLSMRGRRLFC